MTPLNLAVVFAPTIMRPATIEREMMDMQIQRQAVQSLIELNKAIFDGAEWSYSTVQILGDARVDFYPYFDYLSLLSQATSRLVAPRLSPALR